MPDDMEMTGLLPDKEENTAKTAQKASFQTEKENLKEITAGIEKGFKNSGYFGVDSEDRKTIPDYLDMPLRHILEAAQLEQSFLTEMREPAMMIYQLLPNDALRDYHFMSMRQVEARGLSVERRHYEPIYAMTMPPAEENPDLLLDDIFYAFNVNRPDDFKGHSLSVSDIIALKVNGEVSFHYVDSFGFKRLEGFLPDNPLKNAEMAVEDDYGMIDGIINNGKNPALELPQTAEKPIAAEQQTSLREELHKQKFPSILERLNCPLPDQTSQKKDASNKNKGMEL